MNLLRGSLDTFSLADLLQWLEINALSGRLTLSRGEDRRTIDIKRGSVVFVSSSRPEERLGVFLHRRGLLPPNVLYDLFAENFATGKNLTRIIIDKKLLPRQKLAEAVEALAIQVLLDLFLWRGASFEFDPTVKTEDILRVQLSLRGQVLAFHGAKSIDDSKRLPAIPKEPLPVGPSWEAQFQRPALAESFFRILEEVSPSGLEVQTVRERFRQFHTFAERLRDKMKAPFRLAPIFDDTAALIRAAFKRDEKPDPDHLIQIAALDPLLTLDLLYFANALRTGSETRMGTPSEAAEVIGPVALRTLFDLVSRPGHLTSSTDRLERIFRRAALSTAVAASHLAEQLDIDPELGYTLGLLELMGGYDALKLILETDLEPGPFRAAVLNEYRPFYGRLLAQKLNLPEPIADLFGTTGVVTVDSPETQQLIFFAKQMVPTERIGREFTSEDPELADRYASLAAVPELAPAIDAEIDRLRQIVAFQ